MGIKEIQKHTNPMILGTIFCGYNSSVRQSFMRKGFTQIKQCDLVNDDSGKMVCFYIFFFLLLLLRNERFGRESKKKKNCNRSVLAKTTAVKIIAL